MRLARGAGQRARRFSAIAVLALAVVTSGCAETLDPSTESTSAEVEWVVDGDTIRLRGGEQVRLLQIDAPEARQDCYGRGSTRALIDLTPKGTKITLEADSRLDSVDKHGRALRYVFVGSTNVNLEMVRLGAASPYFFRKDRGRYADDLLSALDEARDEQRGYWAACPRAEVNTGLGSVTGPVSSERG